jgi:hypothetical protein
MLFEEKQNEALFRHAAFARPKMALYGALSGSESVVKALTAARYF